MELDQGTVTLSLSNIPAAKRFQIALSNSYTAAGNSLVAPSGEIVTVPAANFSAQHADHITYSGQYALVEHGGTLRLFYTATPYDWENLTQVSSVATGGGTSIGDNFQNGAGFALSENGRYLAVFGTGSYGEFNAGQYDPVVGFYYLNPAFDLSNCANAPTYRHYLSNFVGAQISGIDLCYDDAGDYLFCWLNENVTKLSLNATWYSTNEPAWDDTWNSTDGNGYCGQYITPTRFAFSDDGLHFWQFFQNYSHPEAGVTHVIALNESAQAFSLNGGHYTAGDVEVYPNDDLANPIWANGSLIYPHDDGKKLLYHDAANLTDEKWVSLSCLTPPAVVFPAEFASISGLTLIPPAGKALIMDCVVADGASVHIVGVSEAG